MMAEPLYTATYCVMPGDLGAQLEDALAAGYSIERELGGGGLDAHATAPNSW